jgi:hypothetical protein
VVQGESTDELCVGSGAVLHSHDLDHVEIGLRGRLVDGKDSVYDIGGQLFGERAVELCGQRRAGDRKEKLAVDLLGKLELIEELHFCQSNSILHGATMTYPQSLSLCKIVSVCDNTRVKTL